MTAFNRAVEGEKLLDQLVEAWASTAVSPEAFADTAGEIAEQWRQHRFDSIPLAGTINTETGEITDREYPTGEEG